MGRGEELPWRDQARCAFFKPGLGLPLPGTWPGRPGLGVGPFRFRMKPSQRPVCVST